MASLCEDLPAGGAVDPANRRRARQGYTSAALRIDESEICLRECACCGASAAMLRVACYACQDTLRRFKLS